MRSAEPSKLPGVLIDYDDQRIWEGHAVPANRHIFRWIGALIGTFALAIGCVTSAWLLYGGSWQTAAQWEAGSLSQLEISELIGTTAYHPQDSTAPHSLLAALGQTLHLPFGDPLQMLTSQFLQPAASVPSPSQGQSSLVGSLSAWQGQTRKIALGWAQYDTPARTIQLLNANPGITVISPEWLTLWSSTGALRDQTEPQVVAYAHQRKVQVWALVNNQFNAQLTHTFLHNPAATARFVQKLTSSAANAHLDGINVDFENIFTDDRDAFGAFIRQLHVALRRDGLQLSVDITPDIVFLHDDAAFFHAGLAADCDYLVVMAYDEHWGGDAEPGPVADVPWVTRAVQDLLDTGVPADRLILGIPFYARFWHVHADGSVSSLATAVSNVPAILTTHGAHLQWDAALGVDYARYPKSDGYEEVWYEGQRTLTRKLTLVNDTNLAGVAVWSLGLSDPHTWSNVIRALRGALS